MIMIIVTIILEKMLAGMRPPLVMIFRPFAPSFADQPLICPTSKSLHPFTALQLPIAKTVHPFAAKRSHSTQFAHF